MQLPGWYRPNPYCWCVINITSEHFVCYAAQAVNRTSLHSVVRFLKLSLSFFKMHSVCYIWCIKSPASRLFTQPFIRAQISSNIKAPGHWPFCGEFTVDRWIPRTKGQQCGKCFHLMTSSWENDYTPSLECAVYKCATSPFQVSN